MLRKDMLMKLDIQLPEYWLRSLQVFIKIV